MKIRLGPQPQGLEETEFDGAEAEACEKYPFPLSLYIWLSVEGLCLEGSRTEDLRVFSKSRYMCPSEPSGIGPQEHGRGLVEKELQGPRLDAALTRAPQSNIAEKDRQFTFRMITA